MSRAVTFIINLGVLNGYCEGIDICNNPPETLEEAFDWSIKKFEFLSKVSYIKKLCITGLGSHSCGLCLYQTKVFGVNICKTCPILQNLSYGEHCEGTPYRDILRCLLEKKYDEIAPLATTFIVSLQKLRDLMKLRDQALSR